MDWLSVPTGLGEILHGILGWATGADEDSFVAVTRLLGLLALAVLAARQWWLARALAAGSGYPWFVRRV